MINMVKLPTNKSSLFLRVAKGHFATSHSHINYYIDVTTQKARLSEAKAVAKELVAAYQHSTIVDTVLCLDGTQVIGTCLANELTKDGFANMNAHQTIYVITPEYTSGSQIILRDNLAPMVRGKHVLILSASITTGYTVQAAIEAGKQALAQIGQEDAGARIMFTFLTGCLKGLDGNFVSPTVSLSLGLEAGQLGLPDPRQDLVRPYCVRFTVCNTRVDVPEFERHLREYSSFALVERHEKGIEVHLHTDHVGKVVEQAVGWGPIKNLHITNMSEGHVLSAHGALMRVALLAVAENKVQAREMQEAGVHIIVSGGESSCPSVGELVNAAHSDLASSYVMLSWSRDFRLAFRQAKRLLGDRVELVLCQDKMQQAKAIKAFDPEKDAAENSRIMQQAAGVAES